MGAAVACDKKGNGAVKATYRLKRVIRIKGEMLKTQDAVWDGEGLAGFTDTAQPQ